MKRVIILGTGLIGCFIANKLHEDQHLDVSACDLVRNPKLHKDIWFETVDLSDPLRLYAAIENNDLVINALPGHMGYRVLEQIILNKINVVDISFMPEDFLQLNDLAKKKKVTAVCDFGFAPGISHMFVSRLEEEFGADCICDITVGGLPAKEWDEYKAVFSPRDVLEEYTRPARYLDKGEIITEIPFEKDYQYDSKLFDEYHPYFDLLGSFISDGLRSLLTTCKFKTIQEYTLRYEEHMEKMRILKGEGFFKPEHIENTAKVLIDKWKMSEDMEDISLLDVSITEDSYTGFVKIKSLIMFDRKTGKDHSMARCTGLPAVRMAKAILNGEYQEKGVIPPEKVAKNVKIYNKIIAYLKENGIKIKTEE